MYRPHASTLVLWLFLLGIAAVATELVLLEHYEDAWQRIPLVLWASG